MLPPFLKPLTTSSSFKAAPVDTVFKHSQKLGDSEAHCLWWPCKSDALNPSPSTVLLFVPGNPGLAGFYTPYLTYISESSPDSLAILAHSLLGHSPHVATVPLPLTSLESQIEGTIEVIDSVKAVYGSSTRVILIGHSVGSWIVLQALKERFDQVAAVFLLCPTIMHIARTPNGRWLSWLFRRPFPRILASISRLLRLFPRQVISLLFREWPAEQVEVLRSFLSSPPAILSSLTMAAEEMATITDLDIVAFDKLKHKLHFFFAEEDDWVGENKEIISREMSDEPHSVRVIHGQHGIPHAFCIHHGRELAESTLKWMQDDASGSSDSDLK